MTHLILVIHVSISQIGKEVPCPRSLARKYGQVSTSQSLFPASIFQPLCPIGHCVLVEAHHGWFQENMEENEYCHRMNWKTWTITLRREEWPQKTDKAAVQRPSTHKSSIAWEFQVSQFPQHFSFPLHPQYTKNNQFGNISPSALLLAHMGGLIYNIFCLLTGKIYRDCVSPQTEVMLPQNL